MPPTDPLAHCDPVGVVEIAERFDVTRKAFDQWRARGRDFPPPARLVGGRPAWAWADVRAWGIKTERLDAGGKPTRLRPHPA